jgi:hypothetical protein
MKIYGHYIYTAETNIGIHNIIFKHPVALIHHSGPDYRL